MKRAKLSGTVEVWRGGGEDRMPIEVSVGPILYQSDTMEGGGFEVDVDECTANGQPFHLTPDELQRAVDVLGETA